MEHNGGVRAISHRLAVGIGEKVSDGMTSLSTMAEDVLQPVSPEEVPRLLDVLNQDMPHSTVAYHWLRVQTAWEEKIPGLNIHVLSPGGDWSQGTMVAYADGLALEGSKYGVVYAREGPQDEVLKQALLQTRVIPWSAMVHMSGVLERHIPTVRAAAEAAGVRLATLKDPTLRVARLSGRDLDAVLSLRDFYPLCMKPVVGAILEHNHAFGVFARRSDGSERLVSVAAEMEHGGLGMGQTDPEYLRQGLNHTLGAHVMAAMGREGKSPNGMTWVTNHVVIKYLKNCGFQVVANCNRVEIAPGKKPTKSKI